MTIFGVRLPSLRAPRQHAPTPPVAVPRPRPLAESYFVVAYYRDPRPSKITLTCTPGDIGAAVEPVWEFRPVA